MNNTIRRIKSLQSQIKSLEKILKDKEYLAAGLTLSLNVGDLKEDEEMDLRNLSFGMYSGIERELLELLLKGCNESLRCNTENLEKDIKSATELLDSIRNTKQ